MILSFFFFFKQKTAYEMRISDWSSDVCSSDLHVAKADAVVEDAENDIHLALEILRFAQPHRQFGVVVADRLPLAPRLIPARVACGRPGVDHLEIALHLRRVRSEEHTSELQSLMRISYAVFCLKKKKIST